MEHRVEPPSWLPEAAAPEGGSPAPGDSTVSMESAADKTSASNGKDGTASYDYSYDSSYADEQDGDAAGDEEDPYLIQDPEPTDEETEATTPVATDLAAPSYYPGFSAEPAFPPEPGLTDPALAGSALVDFALADEADRPGVTDAAMADPELADPRVTAPGMAEPGPVAAGPAFASFGAADPLAPGLASAAPPGLAGGPVAGPPAAGAPAAGTETSAPAAGPEAATRRTYAAAPKSKQAAPARRAANLVIARFEPWSVMKFSFLISLVAWIVLFVAVAILYYALSGLGVFTAIQHTLSNVTSSQGSSGVSLSKWTSAPRVLGYTMLIGAVNVVLITALSTVGAMIYNLVTHLGGGIEVTLRETD